MYVTWEAQNEVFSFQNAKAVALITIYIFLLQNEDSESEYDIEIELYVNIFCGYVHPCYLYTTKERFLFP